MNGQTIQILIAMVIYMAIVIAIGIVFAKRANKSSDDYFLGGRSLGPWVTAFSASASDMSGWLLMGLPGVAYWCGLADAAWTAIGLALGTYLNWLIVSKRLRRYSVRANNSITLPDFFSRLAHSGLEIYLKKISLDLPLGTRVRLSDKDGFFAIGEVREFDDGLAIKPIRQFGEI